MRVAGTHDPDEPLEAWWEECGARDGVRHARLEYSSRGDRIAARMLLPEASGPAPLVLAAHGARGSKDAPYMDTACLPWARGGAAVLAIDLPLHGERSSAKLSERVLGAIHPGAQPSVLEASLWVDWVRQAVADLARGLEAAGERPEVDTTRVGFAGFSLGTLVGSVFCAQEPRVAAGALAIGGAALGPKEVDPAGFVPRFAPRPLLFVNALQDEVMPRVNAEALHAAASEPKQVLWFECGHTDLPGAALKAMWEFLREHLQVAAPR